MDMGDYFEGFSEEITRWEIIKEMIDLDLDDEFSKEHKIVQGVQLLPRQDVILYGTIPKIEQRIYTKCKECRLVFNPRDISSHKSCPGKSHSSTHSLKKKIKSKGSSNKKFHTSLPPPPIFKKPPCPSPTPAALVIIPEPVLPKISLPNPPKISSAPTVTSPVPTKSESKSDVKMSPKSISKSASSDDPARTKTASPTESSSNRHKKSRKSGNNNKIAKEFDPDMHCRVVEGSRGPCTRSITCSNHRIQLRKLVSGRSKDIHQLIAESETVKEKELKHGSNCAYMSPNGGEEKDSFSQNTTYVPVVAAVTNACESAEATHTPYVPLLPKNTDSSTLLKQTTTSLLTAKQPISTDSENISSKTMDNTDIMNIHSQESAVGTVPVVYIPMSPISVVSPVQFVQIGKNVICLESPQSAMSPPMTTNQSVYLTIPSQNSSNVKMYKSHPKPVAVPNYGGKKVGGAILLLNQRVECQRNNVFMAINTKRKTVNNSHNYRAISLLNHNNVHRPNILKIKGVNKVNCKRSATDKLNSSDSKQMRLTPNVNGFILHSDISETADAPQSNHCLQEKKALLNMK